MGSKHYNTNQKPSYEGTAENSKADQDILMECDQMRLNF